MFLTAFTVAHVVISLVGIGAGLIVLGGLIAAIRFDLWTALFLATTVLTSVTGFLFPFEHFLPSHAVGVLSLLVLVVAIVARYARQLGGAWRLTYVISAVTALYLNVFVLIAQMFQKIPALETLALTQSEPPFLVVQAVALALFVTVGVVGAIRFQTQPAR